jgi:hypothetical protein
MDFIINNIWTWFSLMLICGFIFSLIFLNQFSCLFEFPWLHNFLKKNFSQDFVFPLSIMISLVSAVFFTISAINLILN